MKAIGFCISLLCMLQGHAVQAQVPGFLGKRFSVFLEANPTPALFVQNSNNKVTAALGTDELMGMENRFAFNFRPQVTVEFLVHQNVSLGLSYSRLMMGVLRSIQGGTEYNTSHTTDPDVIRGQAAGIHLKIYSFETSATVPPIGFYQTFSGYITQTNTYDDKESSANQFKNDFIYPVVTYGWGRQSMIAKNFLLKTGVEIGWAIVPFNFLKETPSDWDMQEYSGYHVHQSLFGYYMFNFNIALGYIPF